MERHPLKSEEVDAEVIIQIKGGSLQVYGLDWMTEEQVNLILKTAYDGMQLHLIENDENSTKH